MHLIGCCPSVIPPNDLITPLITAASLSVIELGPCDWLLGFPGWSVDRIQVLARTAAGRFIGKFQYTLSRFLQKDPKDGPLAH